MIYRSHELNFTLIADAVKGTSEEISMNLDFKSSIDSIKVNRFLL